MAKNKGGRPKLLEVNEKTLKQAETLAGKGLSKEQIARVLGVCYNTLNERQKENPEFAEAIKNGKAKGIAQVSNALFNKAIDGDNAAMIFYLKTQAGWKEAKDEQEKDVTPVVNVFLDGKKE